MSITAPIVGKIAKIKSTKFPQYLFEYHLQSKKVYLIVLAGRWYGNHFEPDYQQLTTRGKLIPVNCENEAHFKSLVDCFFLGFRLGEAHNAGTEPNV